MPLISVFVIIRDDLIFVNIVSARAFVWAVVRNDANLAELTAPHDAVDPACFDADIKAPINFESYLLTDSFFNLHFQKYYVDSSSE